MLFGYVTFLPVIISITPFKFFTMNGIFSVFLTFCTFESPRTVCCITLFNDIGQSLSHLDFKCLEMNYMVIN